MKQYIKSIRFCTECPERVHVVAESSPYIRFDICNKTKRILPDRELLPCKLDSFNGKLQVIPIPEWCPLEEADKV